jgi:RNA polymerase sigma-70 factor (ECF subfamily)
VGRDADDLGDIELIARSLDEPALFAALLTRYHRPIYRYLARRLPADAAEDCAQETFVRGFAARGSFRPCGDSRCRGSAASRRTSSASTLATRHARGVA